jgi:YggT family protein
MSFDFGFFGNGLIGILHSVLQLYMFILLARVLISWISPDPNNPIVHFLRSITDPAIDWLRRVLPRFFWSSGLDFTPLVLILLLQVAMRFLDSVRLG